MKGSISQDGDGGIVALAIVNTILGGSTGGIAVLLLTKFKWIAKNFVRTSISIHCQKMYKNIRPLSHKERPELFFFQFLKQKAERGKWSFLLTLNGALAGMVSFLLILIGSFLSFYRIHVRSLH